MVLRLVWDKRGKEGCQVVGESSGRAETEDWDYVGLGIGGEAKANHRHPKA